MSSTAYGPTGQASVVSASLDGLFKDYAGPPFEIRFWDNTSWYSHAAERAFAICLRTAEAWQALCTSPDDAALGTRYIDGEIEVDGELYQALRALPSIEQTIRKNAVGSVAALRDTLMTVADRIGRFVQWGTLHSERRDAASIALHYDKPAAFYELFLGQSMVYSCAYFRSPARSLDEAQCDKMDLICRKLGLRAGERFLDIGCGWGSLVLHAREKYGASTVGVSLSRKQVDYAQRRIARSRSTLAWDTPSWEGLGCDVLLQHFRDLDAAQLFDKIASVGMCEHVGRKQITDYFRRAYGLLAPGGLFLNHGITRSAGARLDRPSFIDKYVFPDGELLTLSEMVLAAEDAGFEVRDVEDLREHYEETLHRWADALSAHEQQAAALTDARTFRIWKLYMTGSAEAFRRGDIAIHQILLSRNDGGRSAGAKVREAWYSEW